MHFNVSDVFYQNVLTNAFRPLLRPS